MKNLCPECAQREVTHKMSWTQQKPKQNGMGWTFACFPCVLVILKGPATDAFERDNFHIRKLVEGECIYS